MDDEEMLRDLGQQMLNRLGYELETVKDGVEVIELYKQGLDSNKPFGAARNYTGAGRPFQGDQVGVAAPILQEMIRPLGHSSNSGEPNLVFSYGTDLCKIARFTSE